MQDLEKLVIKWAEDRNLIKGSDSKNQFLKLIQEAGELSDNLCKGKDIRDDIGDIMVVLTIIARQQGTSLDECYGIAYNDIKDRTGKMINGIFVKKLDLL